MILAHQATKDESITRICDSLDPKIIAYRFLTNKYTKDPDNYNKFKNDAMVKEVNREVIRLSFEEYLKRHGINYLVLSEQGTEMARKDFKIRFMKGEFVQNPLQYMNI